MTAPARKPEPAPRPPPAVFKAAEALARIVLKDELLARETQRG